MKESKNALLDNFEKDIPFYKRKKLLFIGGGIIILILIIIIIIVAVSRSKEIIITPPPESTNFIVNPDQGTTKYVGVTITEETISYWLYTEKNPYDCRIDISAFSKKSNGKEDKPLTDKALENLNKMMQEIRERGRSAVVRFAYDPEMRGDENMECEMEMIKTHIKQIGEILNNYPDVLIGIEAGLVGPWGEMHSSEIVTYENVSIIINEWLNVIKNKEIPILVRFPGNIYHYFGKEKVDEMKSIFLKPEDKGYNLGVWNDCIYGSDNDVGTWKEDRTKEIEWISTINTHLPYGGEYCQYEETDVYKMEKCIPELFKNRMNFIGTYCEFVENKLKSQIYKSSIAGHKIFEGKTVLDFVNAHLGYRFVMNKITIKLDGKKFDLKINLVNNGFGNLNKVKKIGLAYSYDKKSVIKEENDLDKFFGNPKEINIKGNLIKEPKDKYYVYLRIYYSIVNGKVNYPISFANNDIFNEELSGNFLFEVDKKNKIIH